MIQGAKPRQIVLVHRMYEVRAKRKTDKIEVSSGSLPSGAWSSNEPPRGLPRKAELA